MKKILLLNLPFNRPVQRDYGCPHGVKADYYWPPVDLLLFGAAVRQHAELSYIDAIAGGTGKTDVLKEITAFCPDIIFTVLSSITLEEDLSFILEVRQYLPDVQLWASGDVVFFSEEEFAGIDYYVRDLTNKRQILDELSSGRSGGAVQTDSSAVFSVGICPHELTRRYAYAMPYSLYRGITCVSTNYGCPFSCTFCNSNKLPFKRRNINEIIEELKYLQTLGIKEIVFRDFTFNMSDADRLCNEMIKNSVKLKWSCWTSASLVNPDILAKMKSAGCYLISYGAESGDEIILSNLKKPVDLDTLRKAVSMTRAAGIEVLTSFIIGFPGEDRAKTESLLFELDPDFLSLNILAPRLGSLIQSQSYPVRGSETDSLLSPDMELLKFRDYLERKFFIRPVKIARYLIQSMESPYRLLIFIRNGFAMIKRWHIHARP